MLSRIFTHTKYILKYGSYIPTEYYVSDIKKLVYVPIPKVACTTFKIATLTNYTDHHHIDNNEYMSVHGNISDKKYYSLPPHCLSYFKFAFVRNPFDRLVSCYEDKVKNPSQHHGHYYFSNNYNLIVIKKLYGKVFQPDMSFDEFVELVCKIPDFLSDAHFRSQYSILHTNSKVIFDKIGKFESIEEDWKEIAHKNNLPSINKINSSDRKHWHSYYKSEKTIKLVIDRYKIDFEHFNYDKHLKT